MKTAKITSYLSMTPLLTDLPNLLEDLRKIIPGTLDRFEFMDWTGKERRGKYDPDRLRSKLESISQNDLSFLSLHKRLREEDINLPTYSVFVARRFLEDNLTTVIYVSLPQGDIIDLPAFARDVYEVLGKYVEIRYGFAVFEPRGNGDFDYPQAITMYVEKPTRGYSIVNKLSNALIVDNSLIEPLLDGFLVRSVYPVNLLVPTCASKVREALDKSGLDDQGHFEKAVNGMVLWTVPKKVNQEKLFGVLAKADLTLEDEWFDLENYLPASAKN